MSTRTAGYVIRPTLELVTEECCSCGITFAMPAEFQQQCINKPGINTGKGFYCPNGHKQWYTGKSDAQRLRDAKRELERARTAARSWQDQAEAAERSRRAQKAVATRIKRRVANGVCPSCTRTFQNLAAHMSDQHPDQVKDANEASESPLQRDHPPPMN